MLAYSAVPRANNTLRTLSPSESAVYAKAHDEAIWGTFMEILGTGEYKADAIARLVAEMVAGLEGMSLRSVHPPIGLPRWMRLQY